MQRLLPASCPCLRVWSAGAAVARAAREAVAAGLLVGPFFRASNVLFYVGTFIWERLLYLPSGKHAPVSLTGRKRRRGVGC